MTYYVRDLKHIKLKHNGVDIDTPDVFKSFHMINNALSAFRTELATTTGTMDPSYGFNQYSRVECNAFENLRNEDFTRGAWFDGEFLFQYLKTGADTVTLYNDQYGTDFAINFRFYNHYDTGGNDYYAMTIETVLGGVSHGSYVTIGYHGIDSGGWYRKFYFGVLTDKDTATGIFYTIGVLENSNGVAEYTVNYGSPSYTRVDWNNYKYQYYLMFADDYDPPVSNDPYANTGEAAEDQLQTGAAQGDPDDSSDVISIPSTPTLNLAACQMINVYVPSLSDVQTLAHYLWTNFDLHDVNNSLSKVFTDPINAILSLHILPFTPGSSTAVTVTFGGYATSVQIPPASEQFHDVDCGSISFSEFWGNYLDYNPYTRITACLPFVGQVDLDPDEVMGKTVKIKYRVDVVTGAFVCFLYIDGEKVLGQYAGNMAQQVPVSAADFSRLNAAILNVASTAAAGFGGAVMGGFSAASAAEGGISAGLGLGQSAVDNVLNAKVRVAHSGGLSGSPGIMGILKPYVIIHRARQSVPADANHFKGYPCNAKFTLADLEGCGFTSVRRIKLDGIKLTEGELEELRQILAAGVYL